MLFILCYRVLLTEFISNRRVYCFVFHTNLWVIHVIRTCLFLSFLKCDKIIGILTVCVSLSRGSCVVCIFGTKAKNEHSSQRTESDTDIYRYLTCGLGNFLYWACVCVLMCCKYSFIQPDRWHLTEEVPEKSIRFHFDWQRIKETILPFRNSYIIFNLTATQLRLVKSQSKKNPRNSNECEEFVQFTDICQFAQHRYVSRTSDCPVPTSLYLNRICQMSDKGMLYIHT